MPGYSETLMDHFLNPRNAGRLAAPDVVGRYGSPERPPFMVLHLQLGDNIVTDARFQTFGCGPAIASGSVLTERIIGRTIAECLNLAADDLVQALGGIPADKHWCAGIAIEALRDALKAYLSADEPCVGSSRK
jgi:NifU-like protein involved in Fe-S cluster formation